MVEDEIHLDRASEQQHVAPRVAETVPLLADGIEVLDESRHFSEGLDGIERTLANAPNDARRSFSVLARGERTVLSTQDPPAG